MPTIAPYELGSYVEIAGFLGGQACFGTVNGEIFIHSTQGEKKIQAHDGLSAACFALNGASLITGGEDGKVLRINTNGNIEQLADLGSKWINSIACGPNNSVAWCVGRDTHVFANGETKIFEQTNTSEDVAFAPKGLRIAIARYNGADLFWAGTNAPSDAFHWDGPHQLIEFSPDGKFLITSMQENSLHGWRLSDGQDLRMSGYPTKVKSFSFSTKGKWLATSGANSCVVWPFSGKDGPIGKTPEQLGYRSDALTSFVACHPHEDVIAIGYNDGLIGMAKIDDGKDVLLRRPDIDPNSGPDEKGDATSNHSAPIHAVSAMAWSPDGNQLIFGTQSGHAGLIDLTS